MSDRSPTSDWPSPLGQAPTPAELLDRLGRAFQSADHAPDQEDVLTSLAEVLEHGSRSYRATNQPIDALEALMARLSDEERSLLMAYEERVNEQADLWATDRFRIGYALGAMLGFPPA